MRYGGWHRHHHLVGKPYALRMTFENLTLSWNCRHQRHRQCATTSSSATRRPTFSTARPARTRFAAAMATTPISSMAMAKRSRSSAARHRHGRHPWLRLHACERCRCRNPEGRARTRTLPTSPATTSATGSTATKAPTGSMAAAATTKLSSLATASDYTITRNGSGSFILEDKRGAGGDGADTVLNVEIFTFTDGSVCAQNLLNPPPSGISIKKDVVDENSSIGKVDRDVHGRWTMSGDSHASRSPTMPAAASKSMRHRGAQGRRRGPSRLRAGDRAQHHREGDRRRRSVDLPNALHHRSRRHG